jgi:hypothetical protein
MLFKTVAVTSPEFITSLPAEGELLDDRPATTEQPEYEQHQRDDQQQVNDSADRVSPDNTEQPKNEQNDRECK